MKIQTVIFLFVLSGSSLANAAEYAFVGKWNCEVSTFTFTNRTYNNGSKTMPFSKIEFGRKGDFRLEFADGYAISLLNVGKNRMTWHSLQSGDTFDCKRMR